jgi:hypothetical protein
MASIAFLTNGGASEEVPGNLSSRNAKNATEQHRKRKRLTSMAMTAAAVTEAERFGK